MILYGLLKVILFILGVLSSIFGTLIPDMPDVIITFLHEISSIISNGFSFISYFFYWDVIVAMINILILWRAFEVTKDIIMKVIGHFLAN